MAGRAGAAGPWSRRSGLVDAPASHVAKPDANTETIGTSAAKPDASAVKIDAKTDTSAVKTDTIDVTPTTSGARIDVKTAASAARAAEGVGRQDCPLSPSKTNVTTTGDSTLTWVAHLTTSDRT